MKKLNQIFEINALKVDEEDKYIITCGKFQATSQLFDSEEEAEEYFNSWPKLPWDLIITAAVAGVETFKTFNK